MDSTVALTRLKLMCASGTDPTLDDPTMDALLVACERTDSTGKQPSDPNWTPTYDLYWGASEAWAWKAGACSDRYKIVGDSTELERNQVFQHCSKMFDLFFKRAAANPQSIRSHGGTLEDRIGIYSSIPWWWELVP